MTQKANYNRTVDNNYHTIMMMKRISDTKTTTFQKRYYLSRLPSLQHPCDQEIVQPALNTDATSANGLAK